MAALEQRLDAAQDVGVQHPPRKDTSSSINVDHRTNHTFVTNFFQSLVRPFKPRLVQEGGDVPAGSPKLDIPAKIRKKAHVVERKVDGIWLYDLKQEATPSASSRHEKAKASRHHVFYFCGGGWKAPPSSHHWKVVALMSQELPETIFTLVSYPLAPHSAAPVAFPQLQKLYTTLLTTAAQQGERVTLAGDSAGGNIVLGLTLEMLRLDPSGLKPHSILAISPSVQLDRSTPNPAIFTVGQHDPLLTLDFVNGTAAGWAGSWDKNDPRISPLQADVSVLQRAGVFVDGLTGGYDILGPDALLFRKKLADYGVEGDWLEWDKQMHCWPMAKTYGLFPESKGAWTWIIEVLKRRGMGQEGGLA